jgi:hypothetical protein
MQERAGLSFMGIICEGQALVPDCSPQKPPFIHNLLESYYTLEEPLARLATYLRVEYEHWFYHLSRFCVSGGDKDTIAI